ncbi:MAG: arginine--tRNA ligase [Hymenobacteraceae bacterium]|nr:arginine--tRNA ligase [Hymenobacteraceae bacterium]MDX5395815.1 arginine--tRNA ligase [Hymenobacteraceae bacterium]MDX5511870.1 arginine--tRNA ligase [Hymenobacteraceae bacterium]
MQLEYILSQAISDALKNLFHVEVAPDKIALQPTRKDFEGSFTFVTFPYTKQACKGPEQIGQALGEYLKENSEEVAGFNVVKGFLNLVISDKTWLKLFSEIALNDELWHRNRTGRKVMVEYSSPNTNKPLHLGHLRNNFLGYSISEILKANGDEVMKVNLINDRGIHICKSMLAYQKFGNFETPDTANIKGDHLVGKYYVEFDKAYKAQVDELVTQKGLTVEEAKKQAPLMQEAQQMLQKWEQNDQEVMDLWGMMNGWVYDGFEQTYRNIGVNFDKYYYESQTYLLGKERVEEGLAKGVFYKKEDGSVWVDLTEEGLDHKLLLRGDGTSVYITQDIGTAELKYQDFPYDQSIYVVADEQNYHFQVLKAALKKLGKPYADAVYHLSYGMVDLPSGKMKSREGTVVDADELVSEIEAAVRVITEERGRIETMTEEEVEELVHMLALGALKYFLLKVDPKKRMLFNPAESVELTGDTGPFVQYTHARIRSIMRKAVEMNINAGTVAFESMESMHETEQELVAHLATYPKAVQDAAVNYAPSIIAQYAYDLAKAYNRFYAEVSIFQEKDPQALSFRIALSRVVAHTIKKAMGLLGIEVPEQM